MDIITTPVANVGKSTPELSALRAFMFNKLLSLFRPKPRRSYSLDQLDLKLTKYLNKRRGVFVEAGANDGVSFSNTLYFEKHLGWRGLLVEPHAEVAKLCQSNRPNAVVEPVALVSFENKAPSITLTAIGLMSFVNGALKTAADENEHIEGSSRANQPAPVQMEVPCATLSSLLDRHNFPVIDLLSLDVEGYEAEVLRGIDFNRHTIRHILVEARYRAEIEEVLQSRYELLEELTYRDLLFGLKR